jgi:exodeoxyribonuclease VIII
MQLSDIPASEYHSWDALSASGAKQLLRSPAHYLASKEQQREPTPAMRFGTLVHAMVLEPHIVDQEFAAMPKVDRRTSVGKQQAELFAATNAGMTVIDMDDFQRAQKVAEAVRSHHLYNDLLKGASVEQSFRWEQHGVPCKARMDAIHGGMIVDLKTTQDASPDGFAKTLAGLKYYVQAAHYLDGYAHSTGFEADRFVFIAVETEAPYAIGVYDLDFVALEAGRHKMALAAEAYKATKSATSWKGYSPKIETLSVPSWVGASLDG